MILDQVFFGVLNEKAGTLEVFDEPQEEVSDCCKDCRANPFRSCSLELWRL